MAQHLAITAAARNAVITGNLDEANAQGKLLRHLPLDGLPQNWQDRLSNLSSAARDLEAAPNIAMAGLAVGEIGQTCSACHLATSGGPKIDGSGIPPQTWTTDSHMPQHLWASEWMWLGMLANNDEAFLRGAKTLSDEPLMQVAPTRPEWFAETEAEVHRIAKEMQAASDLPAREALYGALLAQCGTCHMRLETDGATPR